MNPASKGLALIPELALSSSCTSSAVAAATAAVLGQSISQGCRSWAAQALAREWTENPYFSQERLSGTRLETVFDPPNGIKYIKAYPPSPQNIWIVLRPRGLTLALCKSLFLQVLVVVVNNLSRLDAAEKEAFETGQEAPRIDIFPQEDIKPLVKRSSIVFLRDVATQSIRQVLDVLAGQKLDPRLAWKLRKGFRSSAIRKRYLPWYIRPVKVAKTVMVSNILSCVAEWTVTSYIDVYRMTKSGWQKQGLSAFNRRLLLRLVGNAVKTSVSMVGASIGAGVISLVWPGTGTALGYNAADLAITLFVIGPLADQYFGSYPPPSGPPPAALDAGALAGDSDTLLANADEQALRGFIEESSDDNEGLNENGDANTNNGSA